MNHLTIGMNDTKNDSKIFLKTVVLSLNVTAILISGITTDTSAILNILSKRWAENSVYCVFI
jgi:hypothetical protein